LTVSSIEYVSGNTAQTSVRTTACETRRHTKHTNLSILSGQHIRSRRTFANTTQVIERVARRASSTVFDVLTDSTVLVAAKAIQSGQAGKSRRRACIVADTLIEEKSRGTQSAAAVIAIDTI